MRVATESLGKDMAHTRVKSATFLSEVQELAAGDTLSSRFFAEENPQRPKSSVFERLYRDSEAKRKPKTKDKKVDTGKPVSMQRPLDGPRIEDVLLRKYEDSKLKLAELRAKWERQIMQEVFPVPHISLKSQELAKRPAPHGGYWRCYAHEHPSSCRWDTRKTVSLQNSWNTLQSSLRLNPPKVTTHTQPSGTSGKESTNAAEPAISPIVIRLPQSIPHSQPISPPETPLHVHTASNPIPISDWADPLEISSFSSSSLHKS